MIAAELLAFLTKPYSSVQRKQLESGILGGTASYYARLDFDVGAWLADAAVAVMAEAGIARADVAAIASHGHTIWHEAPAATWQIGSAAVIAERTGVPVISDFRSRDVAAGGQGAPLVAIADAVLFSSRDKWRATLNLGGIANVQLLPPGGVIESVRAFDTGPGVAVLDAMVRELFPGVPYDVGGAIARRGSPITKLVEGWLNAPYFNVPPPKSTGREIFSALFAQSLVEQCRRVAAGCSAEDIVATATLFTARSIALAFEKFIPEPVEEVLVAGGGAKNPALLDSIRAEIESAAHRSKSRVPSVVPFEKVIYFDSARPWNLVALRAARLAPLAAPRRQRPQCHQCARPANPRLVHTGVTFASLLVPALRWNPEQGFAHLRRTIDDALGAGVGGFLIFDGPRAAVADLTAELHARSAVPLLIAADTERGAGQQFDGCIELPPFGALGLLENPAVMRRAGQITARDLKRIGINWALAPVCDLDPASGKHDHRNARGGGESRLEVAR